MKSEVEEEIINGKFCVYTMNNLNDAIEALLLEEDETIEEFYEKLQEEVDKYKDKDKNRK